MRVVLDANILISAFLYGGALSFIANGTRDQTITPCFSDVTWGEFERVLQYPKFAALLHSKSIDPGELLARLELDAKFSPTIPSPVPIPNDHDDEAILACAIAPNARCIVTGDQHLLSFAPHFLPPIVTPRQFQDMLSAQGL